MTGQEALPRQQRGASPADLGPAELLLVLEPRLSALRRRLPARRRPVRAVLGTVTRRRDRRCAYRGPMMRTTAAVRAPSNASGDLPGPATCAPSRAHAAEPLGAPPDQGAAAAASRLVGARSA